MLLLIATIHVPTISWQETLARLALAALLGGLIGIEREFREHEAGLRTHTLVAVGAGLFTIVSAFGFHDVLAHQTTVVARLDPSRISAHPDHQSADMRVGGRTLQLDPVRPNGRPQPFLTEHNQASGLIAQPPQPAAATPADRVPGVNPDL